MKALISRFFNFHWEVYYHRNEDFFALSSLAYGQSQVSTQLNLPLYLLHRRIEFCFDILCMYHMYMYMHVHVLSGPLSMLNWLPWCDIPSLINTAGLTLNNPNIPYTCATCTLI